MTDDLKTREDIEHGETWLAKLCARSEPVDVSAIKKRVRVAIGEKWLAQRLNDANDAQVTGRMRGKLRESIARASRAGAPEFLRSTHRLHWVAVSAVGVAAMLLITFGDLLGRATQIDDVREEIEAPYANAFEQYEGDEWDTSLGELSSEFESLVSASRSGVRLDTNAESAESSNDALDGWFDAEDGDSMTDG